ncbi:PAS/PAC sensor hybrid histidine kinase [Crinalium epipsammum PCC 9333]|uniref:Circadian input-output histidine kinase CikA n=1 Tax=Crinalium epipsammum PCC 9333 TaxID=1173022 RepID=K9W072_9CYAN|nr:ATP-binding protein [Crinalium epipsammum]AFZ13783.1 PAS/PAC sensor hybrid histidine kinase [Crinalium epipsammum PCC 9333]
MSGQSPQAEIGNFLLGGGEMGARMRSHDWSQTPLGSVDTWQQSLKTAVRIMLTSRQPMFVWWGDQLINLYNDPYKAILGGKHPQVLGQPASDVWQEIWDQVGPRAESALIKNEATYDEALLLIMERNGYPEETYYTFSYSPVPNDYGGTGGIICANTDDTQRIIGERQLALLRELAARTVDARTFEQACSLSLGCLETNPYDLPWAMIYLVDPEQQRIVLAGTCGIDPNHEAVPEIVDFNADSVWHLAEVIKTNKSYVISNLDTTFDNLPTGAWQISPHQAVALPIAASGETGKSGILVVGLNPFRLFDDKYQGFIDLVASQIAASIANAQAYEEERKRAEALAEIDRAKTVFFSNVSHEFRTPLTLMLGPLEDTLTNCATLLPPREREQLEMVQRNAYRLLKLVNTLLDFSRIEAGRVQASYEPTDLATFTSELASVFRSAIERAGMQLSVNCPSLPEPVYIDREMWEKIVLNLLSNAFKFTFTGEITVSLKLSNDDVELVVQDTGIGIPAAEIPHMFERFHRVKGAQGRTFEGSGIGLSLVQELVQIHGGTIQVTSVEGEGSCFTVSIPRGSAHLPQDRIKCDRTLASTALGAIPYLEEALRWLPEEAGEQGSRGAGEHESFIFSPPSSHLSPPSPARILLADDNTDMRDYVKRLLSQQYEVEAVPDGLAALSAARQRLPDLVLTDVMMPGLDGFGVLQELRNDPQLRKVPIILLSARAGEEARVEGLEAGADDYLIKPFSARELLARVEAALKMARLREEAMQREQGLRIEAEVAKAHLETVLSGIQDQFYVLDREWRYTFVNDRVAKTVGYSKEDLLGKNIWELFPDVTSSLFAQELHRAVKEQTVVRFEYFYPSWQRWFENRVYPFNEGVTIFVTDISDRKQAEKALRESEERFRNMADNAPFMVWVTDPTGYCTYLSQSWYEFSGQTEATGLGFGWVDAVHPEDREYAKKTFLTANERGDAYRAEFRLRRKDGEYRWVIDAAHPWVGVDGQFKGFIGSVIDISERKQAEAERDRLLQLEQAARKEAETANRVKDEFLAVLSHELRSPLNPILGWTKLLQSRKYDEQFTKRALETIERNAKLQTQLIEDLLDVSRILQGKMVLNIAPVNLVTTITSAIETVRLSAEAKQIQIQTLFTAHVGQVMGDAVRLQQIVWNLLSNAIKFTPSGGQVIICLEQVGMNIQIQVKDTGKGIKPEFLPYVFEYFRQEDGKTTRKFGGLGLGLAIVRYLTELHGGTVQAESLGEEMGATFTVTLPLIQQEDVPIINPEVPLSLNVDTSPLAGVKILVVDDEPDMRELMLTILELSGAEVQIATSAAEALTKIDSFNANMLISDIGMPEMDGYMLMRQVRQRSPQAGGNIMAIALTAYAGEIDQQQALAAGFQRHIAKPVDPVELVKIISNMLRQA